jgi:hypothetical protein
MTNSGSNDGNFSAIRELFEVIWVMTGDPYLGFRPHRVEFGRHHSTIATETPSFYLDNAPRSGRRADPPLCCPNPELPRAEDVKPLYVECESALASAQIDAVTHIRALARVGEPRVPELSHRPDSLGLVDYHGFLIPHPQIDRFIASNQERIQRASTRALLPSPPVVESSLLRGSAAVVDELAEEVVPVFVTVFWRHKFTLEKSHALAAQYRAIQETWRVNCAAVDLYNARTHECGCDGNWGSEQVCGPTKSYGGAAVTGGAAADTPMLIDPGLRGTLRFVDWNRLVGDPIAEHTKFKRRIVWTPEEHKIFRDRWAMSPHKFHQIAEHLPDKSVKDVIEHYYLTKSREGLSAAKRRSKHKVVAEGTVVQRGRTK